MMVSLGVRVRRLRRTLRRWSVSPRLHAAGQGAACAGGGLVLAAASLGSIPQPLALGMLLSLSGWSAVLLALGAAAGYILFWGAAGAQGVVWIMLGLGIVLLVGDGALRARFPLLMSAFGALLVSASGLVYLLWMGDETRFAPYLLRVCLAFGSTAVFEAAAKRQDSALRWPVQGLFVLALAQISVTPWVNFGCAAGAYLSCAGALPAAALAGLALDLAQVTPVPMTAVLTAAYLIRLPRWMNNRLRTCAPAAVFLLVMALCGSWDLHPLPGIAIGCVAAVFAPQPLPFTRRRGESGVVQVRLEMAASVLDVTRDLIREAEEPPIDEAALLRRAIERSCSGCPCRKGCREKLDALPESLLHRPLGDGSDLPLTCRKSGRMLRELRRCQEQLRAIRADREKRREYRGAVVQQYTFLAAFLRATGDDICRRDFSGETRFRPEVAVCAASRERANGDRCLNFAGPRGRYFLVLCDGMGTGAEAAEEGRRGAEILRRLLGAGFPSEYALRTVNSLCALRGLAGAVTVDLAELELNTGRATVYKWGAPPSYILAQGEAIPVGSLTPPPGLSVTDGRETVQKLSLRRGETLVLLSDGAGGEEVLRRVFGASEGSPGELASKILEAGFSDGADDATVAVVRLCPEAVGVG